MKQLFERRVITPVYKSLAVELDAVRDREKALALEVWPAGDLDVDYARFVRAAHARGLEVIERADAGAIAVYALYVEQAWRVPALHALWRFHRPWSDEAERLEAHLLGYSDAMIETWLAERRRDRCGWIGQTIYVLARLPATHVPAEALPAQAAWCDSTRRFKQVKQPVSRFAVTEAAFAALFPAGGAVRTITLEPAHAKLVNRALVSKVERLTARGWSA